MKNRIKNFLLCDIDMNTVHNKKTLYRHVILSHYGHDDVQKTIEHIKTYFKCKDYKVIKCYYDVNFGGNYHALLQYDKNYNNCINNDYKFIYMY